jgi:hypothetical protein
MAENKDLIISGTPQEQKRFTECNSHYTLAKQDLLQRIQRKNGFDDADKMYASWLDESNWPYKSMMFDPRPYTVILEKTARLIGSKPKGRLVPREGGDTLGAYVNNALLSFQWDDNGRLGEPMLSKWIMMDMNARKYGSSFAICPWRWEQKIEDGKKKVFYDGPDFKVCSNRDVLANPSYSYINKWFQYREYITLDELQRANDTAKSLPIYKNLAQLRQSLREEAKNKGDKRSTQYVNQNKSMRGLTDTMGEDTVYPPVEIVTEYRPDRWITFCPRHGVIIRDIPNPYKHGEIPVVHLKYYPLPDDLYGVSELEPVAKQIKGINCLFSQYIDNITVDLYPPLMVNPVNVRMHTLEFTPEAKWLMNTPGKDVMRLETSTAATNNFQSAYSLMVGSLLNALGEQSQQMSSTNPFEDRNRVTATEIKSGTFTRNVRDNMNQIFLSEALKRQIMLWHSMNQQFMFSGKTDKVKVIRIVGRDAVNFFKNKGLSDIHPTEEDVMSQMNGVDPQPYMEGPQFPVEYGGDVVPKFSPDQLGEGGNLYIEEGDLMGTYDYIPDIETMKAPTDEDIEAKLTSILGVLTNPAILQMIAAEGKKPKVVDLLVKLFEATKVIKDADAFFEDLPPQEQMGGVNGQQQPGQGGVNPPEAGLPGQGVGGNPGMEGNTPPMAGGQNPQFMG